MEIRLTTGVLQFKKYGHAVTKRKTYLVVGGDSLVGGETLRAFHQNNLTAIATTRRANSVGSERILLDFELPETYRVPEGISCALVIAAATNYERCATDLMAAKTNLELIPNLVVSLIRQGIHVIYISTNSVFGGEQYWPDEDAKHWPGIPYAEQKSLSEIAILRALGGTDGEAHFSIVRLTKILRHDVSPLPNWLAAWARGEAIEPFEDLIFAPMSANFCANSLVTLAEKRIPGNLHLSGADNVSYVEFAQAVARRFGVDETLIHPTTSVAKGINIPFLPKFSGLGMPRTTRLSGLSPQPLQAVVADIFPRGAVI